MDEQMGIIKDIGMGNRDAGEPCIWFTVRTITYSFLHIITGAEKIYDFISDCDVSDIHNLNGKPCRVRIEDGIGTFLGLLK